MPMDHDVATAPLERHLLPRTAEVDGHGHLLVGGIDLLELAQEFGTPLFVYDEEHLRHACREAVAAWGDGVAYATKAFLCRAMARLAYEEGMHLDVASGGELHVALAAGVPPERLVLHGNNKSTDELATALEFGSGSDRRRLLRRDRPARRPARVGPARRDAAPGPGPGDPGRRGAHPRVRAHRPGGLQVRVLGLLRRGRRGGRRARAAARRRAGRGPRPHRQPGLRRLLVRAGGRGARRVLRPARSARAGGGRRPRRPLRQRRVGADPGRVGRRDPRAPAPRPASLRRRGSRPSPGVRSWPPPASRSTPWARSSTSRASAPTSASTAG